MRTLSAYWDSSSWIYLLVIFFTTCLIPDCRCQFGNWWSIATRTDLLGANTPELLLLSAAPNFCSRLEGLSKGQERLCTLYQDHMLAVAQGAGLAIKECQLQFQHRRWNCTAIDNKTDRVFGPIMRIGSRESGFVNAISAAGVTYAVSRSCREGELSSCGCSRAPRPKQVREDWVWGGCGDNVQYGYVFAQGFVDIREKEKTPKRGSADQARALMNLHNNEAGRRTVYRAAKIACKCHGVSGSCSLKTCWQQLPPFRDIGIKIKTKYDGASKVFLNKRQLLQAMDRRYKAPTVFDMVYLAESPDYCLPNRKIGSLGTQDRKCNPKSQGTDGCDIMCCGRGFNTKKETIRERCECKFQWCCYVACKTCERVVETHTCK
ncbi:Protein Wnt-5b [Hypsibius exemplaris]|uniref:Protein Wnt n=1 Tax=Hypsibius exemplaris TaxID=2072580 RepID=A0A1W0XCI6_HYPEX|nr:Protein Wnt-5b [Hypsibius exemplaris]